MALVACTGFDTTLPVKWEIGEDIPISFTSLSMAQGDYTYLQVSDGVNTEIIKVTLEDDGEFTVERCQCDTDKATFAKGACVKCLPGMDCFTGDTDCPYVTAITTGTLVIAQDTADCSYSVDLPDYLLEPYEFDICEESQESTTFLSTDELVVNRACDLVSVPLTALCDYLIGCAAVPGNGPLTPQSGAVVCAILSDTLDISVGVDGCTYTIEYNCPASGVVPGTYGGLTIDACGMITNVLPDFGLGLTKAEVEACIDATDFGILTINTNTPLTTDGDPDNPTLGMTPIHPVTGTVCNGVLIDQWGRVTGCVPGTVTLSGITTTDPCITISETGGVFTIGHTNTALGPNVVTYEGLSITVDACGHVTNIESIVVPETTQTISGCVSLVNGLMVGNNGMTSSLVGAEVIVVFDTPFANSEYSLIITDDTGMAVGGATVKSTAGISIPQGTGTVCITAVGLI